MRRQKNPWIVSIDSSGARFQIFKSIYGLVYEIYIQKFRIKIHDHFHTIRNL